MSKLRSAAGLTALLVGAAGAVAGLHRLGTLPWLHVPTERLGTWLATTATADVVVALLRLVALGCAYWLLISTAVYTLARLSRLPGAVRAVRWATLPAVRHLADRAVAMTVAVSAAMGAATPVALAAEPLGPRPIPVAGDSSEDVIAPPGAPLPHYVPTPAGDAAGERQPGSEPAAPAQAPSAARAAPAQPGGIAAGQGQGHLVVAGDNLWDIAARRLAEATGRRRAELSPRDIHAYWIRVIAANRATLRSGDANLIYPGEQVALPPLEGPGR